jgi:hypothetical protein
MDDRMILITENTLKSVAPGLNYSDRFKSLVWTSNVNQELPIKMTAHGPGSETPQTLSKLFVKKSSMLKDELCLQAIKEIFPKDGPKDQMLKPKALKLLKYTWQNYYEMALHFAKALVAIGV